MAEIGKVNMTRAGSVMQENDMSAHKIFVLITLLASLTAPVSAQDTSIREYNSLSRMLMFREGDLSSEMLPMLTKG